MDDLRKFARYFLPYKVELIIGLTCVLASVVFNLYIPIIVGHAIDENWGQVMIGQGIMPRSWSPLADNVPGQDVGPFLDTLAKSYRVKAETLPSHRDFVTSMTGDALEKHA